MFLWLLLPAAAVAVVVTAAQIADAVRNSPNSNAWLRTNADAVGNLAVRVESGGNTAAYNGSCCSGVLQMNETNIRQYALISPAEYRQLDLQSQVDAWAQLTSTALQAQAPRTLASMATFDNRPVDGRLVLSCIQLGIGNCQTMLTAGRCSGFADSNGTTICGMADRMVGGTATAGTGTGTTSPPAATGSGGSSVPASTCNRDAQGRCMSTTQSLEAGFQEGSGVSMADLKFVIQGIVVAMTLLIVGWAFLGTFRLYSHGRIAKADLILAWQKAGLIVIMIFIAITLV